MNKQKQTNKQYSQEQRAAILEEFVAGASEKEIIDKWGISKTTLLNWAKGAKSPTAVGKVDVAPMDKDLVKENEILWGLVKRQVREGKLHLS